MNNPFGEEDVGARALLATVQIFVFAIALLLLALVSYS
jgi:hypothetical protein